jgi:hypothetical protein
MMMPFLSGNVWQKWLPISWTKRAYWSCSPPLWLPKLGKLKSEVMRARWTRVGEPYSKLSAMLSRRRSQACSPMS